jgi:hypothetical protein
VLFRTHATGRHSEKQQQLPQLLCGEAKASFIWTKVKDTVEVNLFKKKEELYVVAQLLQRLGKTLPDQPSPKLISPEKLDLPRALFYLFARPDDAWHDALIVRL